jgi:hypothetical protein
MCAIAKDLDNPKQIPLSSTDEDEGGRDHPSKLSQLS